MSKWSDAFPVVSVTKASEPKHVTLVVPYYECPQFFAKQLAHWCHLRAALASLEHLRRYFSIIVIDDGSPRHPASDALGPFELSQSLRLFRIEVDVPWNWLAARNIGAHEAVNTWLLLTDMDHVVPQETIEAAIHGQHDPNVVYGFSRVEHTGQPVHPHSASFLMTRKMFWTIGGYDERLSGVYGTDGAYRKRVERTAAIQILRDVLVRHEYVDDASADLPRKTPAMREARKQRFANALPGPPKVLSFPYHEVRQ